MALAHDIVGFSGYAISLCLFLSSGPASYKITIDRAVGELNPYGYLATTAKCALWVFYGTLMVHGHTMIVQIIINAVGLLLQFVYLLIFYIHATGSSQMRVLLWLVVEAILFIGIVLITMLALHATSERLLVVGVLSHLSNALMYLSPLTFLPLVMRTRMVTYMPLWICFANFFCALWWTAYALIPPFDIFGLISNSIGIGSGLIQLATYAYYRSYPPAPAQGAVGA